MREDIRNLIDNDREFQEIIQELIENTTVQEMKNYRQHYETTCYDHCYVVSYFCYLICKKYNLGGKDYEIRLLNLWIYLR